MELQDIDLATRRGKPQRPARCIGQELRLGGEERTKLRLLILLKQIPIIFNIMI